MNQNASATGDQERRFVSGLQGTFAPIVGEPVLVEVPPRTLQMLDRLEMGLDSALAIVCPGEASRVSIDDLLLFDITRPADEFVRMRLA